MCLCCKQSQNQITFIGNEWNFDGVQNLLSITASLNAGDFLVLFFTRVHTKQEQASNSTQQFWHAVISFGLYCFSEQSLHPRDNRAHRQLGGSHPTSLLWLRSPKRPSAHVKVVHENESSVEPLQWQSVLRLTLIGSLLRLAARSVQLGGKKWNKKNCLPS